MVFPVLNRIHWGIGRFCFWALASFCFVRKDLLDYPAGCRQYYCTLLLTRAFFLRGHREVGNELTGIVMDCPTKAWCRRLQFDLEEYPRWSKDRGVR